MAALSKTNRTKVRVIVGVLGLWIAIAIGTALWPRFPSGNCPDTPPDTAYVCRVAFGQDFEKASRRRNVLVVLEIGVLLSVGSALWLLSDKPLRRRSLELDTGDRRSSPAGASRRSATAPVPQAHGLGRVSAQAPAQAPAQTPAPTPTPPMPSAPQTSPPPVAPPAPPTPPPPVSVSEVPKVASPSPSAQTSPQSAPTEPPAATKARRGRDEKRAAKEARKAEKLGRRAAKPPAESSKSGKEARPEDQAGKESKA